VQEDGQFRLCRGTWPQLYVFSCSRAVLTLQFAKSCAQVLSDLECACNTARRCLNIVVSKISCHFSLGHGIQSVPWPLAVPCPGYPYSTHTI
jgi:hypothetical protein